MAYGKNIFRGRGWESGGRSQSHDYKQKILLEQVHRSSSQIGGGGSLLFDLNLENERNTVGGWKKIENKTHDGGEQNQKRTRHPLREKSMQIFVATVWALPRDGDALSMPKARCLRNGDKPKLFGNGEILHAATDDQFSTTLYLAGAPRQHPWCLRNKRNPLLAQGGGEMRCLNTGSIYKTILGGDQNDGQKRCRVAQARPRLGAWLHFGVCGWWVWLAPPGHRCRPRGCGWIRDPPSAPVGQIRREPFPAAHGRDRRCLRGNVRLDQAKSQENHRTA